MEELAQDGSGCCASRTRRHRTRSCWCWTRQPVRTRCSRLKCSRKWSTVTGLVVTKLDGSARGGIVVALAETFGLPVHAVGVGEQADDLRPFDAFDFARGLVGADPSLAGLLAEPAGRSSPRSAGTARSSGPLAGPIRRPHRHRTARPVIEKTSPAAAGLIAPGRNVCLCNCEVMNLSLAAALSTCKVRRHAPGGNRQALADAPLQIHRAHRGFEHEKALARVSPKALQPHARQRLHLAKPGTCVALELPRGCRSHDHRRLTRHGDGLPNAGACVLRQR